MRSLRTSSATWRSSVTVSVSRRTRSLGTARFSTTGSSSRKVTSCSSSEMAGPLVAASRLASVIGSRSTRTSSRCTGTVTCWVSVTTDLRSRARPRSRVSVPARSAVLDVVVDAVAVPVLVAAGGAVLQAVVAPQLLLLGLRQMLVGVDPGGVLDQLLLVGDLDLVAGAAGLGQGDEAGLGPEQAGVDQGPLGLAGLVVDVDGVDGADLVAVSVDQGGALPAADGVDIGHVHSLLIRSLAALGGWLVRGSAATGQALPRTDPVSAAAATAAAGTELLGG